MTVTRIDILTRGLTNRCPNCGGKTLFVPGKVFQMHESCPACGFKFEGASGQEGFYNWIEFSHRYAVQRSNLACMELPPSPLAFSKVESFTTNTSLPLSHSVVSMRPRESIS